MKRRSNGRRLTCALPIIAGICSLALAIAPFCPAQTEQPTTTGKSASGNTRWEIRSPVDNRGVSTIWIWPNGQKDKATQLAETPNFNQIAGQDAEARLNDIYRELRSLLDEPGKESLRLEELVWLKKRDEIKNPQEKNDFTNARCDELGDRIQKLRK